MSNHSHMKYLPDIKIKGYSLTISILYSCPITKARLSCRSNASWRGDGAWMTCLGSTWGIREQIVNKQKLEDLIFTIILFCKLY